MAELLRLFYLGTLDLVHYSSIQTHSLHPPTKLVKDTTALLFQIIQRGDASFICRF